MPSIDITKCCNNECLKRYECLRYTSPVNTNGQSWGMWKYDEKTDKCFGFIKE